MDECSVHLEMNISVTFQYIYFTLGFILGYDRSIESRHCFLGILGIIGRKNIKHGCILNAYSPDPKEVGR